MLFDPRDAVNPSWRLNYSIHAVDALESNSMEQRLNPPIFIM
jgi:hypothetical protein